MNEATLYLLIVTFLSQRVSRWHFMGVNLSEPHTGGTALRKCVCIYACLLAAIYRNFIFPEN